MSTPANKVGEIFREAATAFNRLSEMTMLLHPMADTQPGGKWTDDEIEMLRNSVHRFAVDLNKLSQHIKARTVSQIRSTLKKKAFEDAGIPVRQVSSTVTSATQQTPQVVSALSIISQQSVLGKNAETTPKDPVKLFFEKKLKIHSRPRLGMVTLNMLNASENEVDVEGLTGDVKLEFEGSLKLV